MLWDVQFALDEGLVDDQLRAFVRKAGPFPSLDLLSHRLEVPLHAVHADGEDVYEIQVLAMFSEHGSEITGEGHVVTDEHTVADREGQTHRLVVGVADGDGETTAVKGGFEVEDAKHLQVVA